MSRDRTLLAFFVVFFTACGGESTPFPRGGEGVPDPLAVPPGEARAGRIDDDELPPDGSPYLTWKGGDFVLANGRVAIVIEDVGHSELYDPWGGRPVGLGRMEDGAIVDPADFGELFLFAGGHTVMTRHVGVVEDGRDGGPAIVRAQGPFRKLPFISHMVETLFRPNLDEVYGAIDYVLEPDSDHVDIYFTYLSPEESDIRVGFLSLHGFMYTMRMPVWGNRGDGFEGAARPADFIAFVDDFGASYTYSVPGADLGSALAVSGFVSNSAPPLTIPPGESSRHHARLTIGGRGLDGALVAHARMSGQAMRAISGRVVDSAGVPVVGANVHAMTGSEEPAHLNRATTDLEGNFQFHLAEGQEADLYLYRRGDRLGGPYAIGGSETAAGDLALPAGGYVVVLAATEPGAGPVPYRVQVRPGPLNTEGVPEPFPSMGELTFPEERIYQEYALPGEDKILRLPEGEWDVIVSRGYEYEIHQVVVDIANNNCEPTVDRLACPTVTPMLTRSVDTAGVMCGDFHIHTLRSNDADDAPRRTLLSAAADGLEIPGRAEHEYVEDWDADVLDMGLGSFMYGLSSLELTTFQMYGHFGAVPLDGNPDAVNGGAVPWQTFPSADAPNRAFITDTPSQLFDRVFARPEQPALIVNHPRGATNYFGYVGLDPMTGTVVDEEAWDTRFHAIEVFNSADWVRNRATDVADWLSLLNTGLRVFAVGASDSHGVARSPVGFPRTCIYVGVDEPPSEVPARRAFADDVRDGIIDGSMVISGGIFVEASVGGVGPGGEATGLGPVASLEVRVQAPNWINVDWVEIIVDGVTMDEIPAEDFVPGVGAEVHVETYPIDVAENGGYVIVAAHTEAPLLIHPNRTPFGATNPIFLSR